MESFVNYHPKVIYDIMRKRIKLLEDRRYELTQELTHLNTEIGSLYTMAIAYEDSIESAEERKVDSFEIQD